MAAQRSKHKPTQLINLHAYNNNKTCPSCNETVFKVEESRKVFDGVRRRYRCAACGFKETRYEVSSETYEELRVLRSKFAAIQQAVSGLPYGLPEPVKAPVEVKEVSEPPDAFQCTDCVHMTPRGCSFEIPEANTEDALGCPLFQEIVW